MKQKIFNEQLRLTVAYINSVAIGALAWAIINPIFSGDSGISWEGAGISAIIHAYARLLFLFLKDESDE